MSAAESLINAAKDDLDELLAILDLQDHGDDRFSGRHPGKSPIKSGGRTYGGQIVGQAMVAAGRTVPAKLSLHSAQTHFIRGGDVTEDIEYRVLRLRDTMTVANRQVTACQGGEVVAVSLIAYQSGRPGLEHSAPMPEVPGPEGLAEIEETFVGLEEELSLFVEALRPTHWRYANKPSWLAKGAGEELAHNRVWLKTKEPLPEDRRTHEAVLAFSSDTTILDSIITQHGLSWGLDRIIAATLNHSLWFHRPFRFDEWLLHATTSPVAAQSRGFSTGTFYTQAGEVVASSAQEGVIIYRPQKA